MENILIAGAITLILVLLLKHEREYSYERRDQVIDHLPWAYLLDDGIILNKDASLQKTFRIRGKDLESMEQMDLVHQRYSLNNAFRRMNGSWAIFIEQKRTQSAPYTASKFSSLILQKIEDIREKKYNSGKYYESEYYLTFVWLPPNDRVSTLKDKFIQEEKEEKDENKYLEEFKEQVKEYVNLIKNEFSEISELNDQETLTYLHSTFSQYDKQVVVPLRSDILLDSYISDTPIVDGFRPKVGDNYIGAISILAFAGESFPGMFNEISKAGVECRWTSRFIFYDKEDSIKISSKVKGRWGNRKRKTFTSLEEKALKKPLEDDDYEAIMAEEEMKDILSMLQNDLISLGKFTFTAIVRNKNKEQLEKDLDIVMSIVQQRGFTAVKENVNTLQAFFGSIPGDFRHNVRKVPLPSMTAIDLFPINSMWCGERKNKHFNAPALFYANSGTGYNSVYFNTHVRDVGHMAMYGRTGAGKSTLLCFIAASFKKYADSQVFIFDKGGSTRVLTTAIGGKFYDLGRDNLSFQPLAKIDDRLERNWAYEWLCEIYEQENVILTPELKDAISEALNSLIDVPENQRTITKFQILLQNNTLRSAIRPYTTDGPFGNYFDGTKDFFNSEYSWQVFEMGKVLESKVVAPPLLKYIFHKLETIMLTEGKPTQIILDECWKVLEDPNFVKKFKDWLKTMRKLNVSVIFATQEITDILESSIKNTLKSSVATTIYLANKKAQTTFDSELYKSLGLNLKQIELISRLRMQRDYYAVSDIGNLDFTPDFSEFELAFFGSNSPQDQSKCVEIETELNKHGYIGEEREREFYKRWRIYKNLKESI